ncbi:PIG-L family deacetylase [Phycisphaera mikurensis]|uniref:Putative deacetylase n=1 Tax=Phycisphaera mikurensis (strain NBRC 102666 / KCTC 22515 / FYK2301M01) TaxID=1142394 RepID=I0IIU0_PHYMF|nr:PIG-L family deacetylase [Phycisphaera mikurensis]MBB6442678.1 bacillithiol biosynthesis deacetylase BshB1 [Phycisphaera mikurensis]BAM05178.1 putative deacetylase [Phycisphaera mikurensis NBRC 102666]
MSAANVLVIGPHPDDQELGMGGTIAKLARSGHKVHVLDMTNGEPTPLGSPEKRRAEWEAATRILDGGSGNVTRENLDLPNRSVTHTLEARHKVAAVMRVQQSEFVFCPYFEDAHPDHVATTRIVEDARFDAKLSNTDLPGEPIHPRRLIYYYCTHLKIVPNPTLLLDISGFEDAKEQSIRAYHTQFVLPEKNAKVVTWVRQQNAFMGSRIGVASAEPFFLKEVAGLRTIDGIL